MFRKFHEKLKDHEEGFTLIELLVVILIIAILAAIAIPVFLNQRKKGWTSQVQSSLKNAATAMETCATETGGEYDHATCGGGTISNSTLASFGFTPTTNVAMSGTANDTAFCVRAEHALHPDTGDTGWKVAIYRSAVGEPTPIDTCSL